MALYKHYNVSGSDDDDRTAEDREHPVLAKKTESIDAAIAREEWPEPATNRQRQPQTQNPATPKAIYSPKVRVVCPHCRKSLTADTSTSGTSAACPSCGGLMEVPFGGIGLGFYWLMRLIVWAVLLPISVSNLGDAAEFAFIGATAVATPIRIYFTIQRSINIGNPWYWGFFGLIPFSVFYFGFTREGAAKKKRIRKPKGRLAKALPPEPH